VLRASHVQSALLHEGALAAYALARDALGDDKTAAVVHGAVVAPFVAVGEVEAVVVVPGEAGLALTEASEAVHRVLQATEQVVAREALLTLVRELGAASGEDVEVVDGLLADGWLLEGGRVGVSGAR
jgi:hypothetical protein